MTNNEIINIFLKRADNKKKGYSEATKNTYLTYIKKYLEWCDNNDIDVIKSETFNVSDFLDELYGDKADKTWNEVLSSVNSLYDSLVFRHIVESNPCDKIECIAKPKTKEKHSISVEDYNKMLRFCKNTRDKAILVMLYNTGIRVNELSSLTLEQYLNRDEDNGINLVVTKGSKERMIYLNKNVIKAIESYLPNRKDTCEYLFVSNYGNKMDKSCIFRTIKTIANRADLEEDVVNNLSAHSFRHTAITNMINRGIDIATVATVVGHSSTEMTYKYIDKSKLRIKEAMMC